MHLFIHTFVAHLILKFYIRLAQTIKYTVGNCTLNASFTYSVPRNKYSSRKKYTNLQLIHSVIKQNVFNKLETT